MGDGRKVKVCTPSRHITLPCGSSPSSSPMSKWLGLRRSGARSPTSAASALPPDDVPAFLGKQDGSGAAFSAPTPRTGRRRSSEETVDAHTSRRSSRDDEDAQKGAAPADHGRGPGDSVSDECCDWEVVQHTSADLSGLVGLDGEAEAERPLSPGVDFSAACMVDREGEEGRQAGASASDCDGNDTCRWKDAASIHSFLVRGPTYLQDKAKLPAGRAMCRLVGFDCFTENSKGTTRIDHIASRGTCRERVEAMTSGDDAPFLFIMNIQVRGTPPVSMVAYWAVDREGLEEAKDAATAAGTLQGVPSDHTDTTETAVDESDTENGLGQSVGESNGLTGAGPQGEGDVSGRESVFSRIVASYADIPVSTFGGDECAMMDTAPPPPYSDERNTRFKLIPRVIGGPWMVRKAVGSTPVLLGTKITHRYYRGERYVETDMDTGSSPAAASLCGRCRGLSRKIDVELGIVLQANSAQELPEALLGAVRLNGFGVEDPDLQTKLYQ